MIIGYLVIGTVFGAIAAASSLFLGFSLISALGLFVAVGSFAVLGLALAVTLRIGG